MYCTKCGAKVSEGKFFCTNCGNPVRDKGEPIVESRAKNERQPAERKSQAINVKQPPERKGQKRGKKPWIIGISSGVLVLAVVIVALFATGVLGGKDTSAKKQKDKTAETEPVIKEKEEITETATPSRGGKHTEEEIKDALEAYQEEIGDAQCCLIYVNDDDIPECVYSDGKEAILTFINGEVVAQGGHHSYSEISYQEKSGKVEFCTGRLGNEIDIFELTSEGFNTLAFAIINIGGDGNVIEEYRIGEKNVGEARYNEYINSFGEFQEVDCTFDTVEEAYQALLNPDSVPKKEIKEALEAYQEEIGDAQCCLIYLNDDDIPECVYLYSSMTQRMLAYINGEVVEQVGCGGYAEISYQEKRSKFLIESDIGAGVSDHEYHHSEIFELATTGFNLIGSAAKVGEYTRDENGYVIDTDYAYRLGESEENVGEARCNEYISSFGQFKKVKCRFETVDKAYKALLDPSSVPETNNSNESSKSSDSSDIVTAQVSDEEQPEAVEINVEEEVKKIRELYNTTQNNLDSLLPAGYSDNIDCYFDEAYPAKVTIPSGYKGWNYNREYYYNNKELYFAFVYKGSEEHRLYFKDGILIRYIDENKNIYDYGNEELASFSEWKNKVQSESEELYSTMINCGA